MINALKQVREPYSWLERDSMCPVLLPHVRLWDGHIEDVFAGEQFVQQRQTSVLSVRKPRQYLDVVPGTAFCVFKLQGTNLKLIF